VIAESPAPVPRHAPVRGTQLLVEHMGSIMKRPSLSLLEIGWRWLVGIPILCVGWYEWQRILAAYPLSASGYGAINSTNPWMAVVQLADVWTFYQPHVFAVLRWLLPAAALAWAVVSGVGRNLVLMHMERDRSPRILFRPVAMIVLQAAWLALLALTFWLWWLSLKETAAAHISSQGEPDLLGFFIWAILLSLGFFTAWALISWALSIAPLLVLLERRSVLSALRESLRLGKSFTSKLAEINFTMGVVKMAIIVLAMVFSAVPVPFSDELGSGAVHMAIAASSIFYMVASDYFQVVRLKAFIEFWSIFRGASLKNRAPMRQAV
jgi:hypothetical protein